MQRITLSLPAPYVGLRPFGQREALLFFGRDTHVSDLVAKLENGQRFLSVMGASGTGKSSLVRAGLIPALHRGSIQSAGSQWNVCLFRPGDAPLTHLAQALTEDPRWVEGDDPETSVSALSATLTLSPLALAHLYRQKAGLFAGQALLLVVDQFEEIFRYRQRKVNEAEAFVKLLLRSASEEVAIYVVITMRSDFLGHSVAFFGLPEAINSGIYLTPRLGPDQLKSVIMSPLALVGGSIDPVLANRLVNTLGGEDELPILEHALLRMWNHAREAGRNTIEPRDFNAVCAAPEYTTDQGLSPRTGSNQPMLGYGIDKHVNAIFKALPADQQSIARRLFAALVERRDGHDVRRPQRLGELIGQCGEHEREALLAVIEAYRADGVGFLQPSTSEALTDDKTIDITHESLFRQWGLFQQWLAQEDLDASELREWHQRAQRQQEGGGWLDANDCERADHWRSRVNARRNPEVWARRYGDSETHRRVEKYIQDSLARVNADKAERDRLEQSARFAETKRLEAEAQLQREAAERAEHERARAEEDSRRSQATAKTLRRQRSIAFTALCIAVILGLTAPSR